MLDFLQSRTFITHITGLMTAFGITAVVPNCPLVSLAIALITGLTQAAHAYQAVRTKPTVSVADLEARLDALAAAPAVVVAPHGKL